MKRFSGSFLISISLPATDHECLLRTDLIFKSLKFKKIAIIQCPPLLAIPMIWIHLVEQILGSMNRETHMCLVFRLRLASFSK